MKWLGINIDHDIASLDRTAAHKPHAQVAILSSDLTADGDLHAVLHADTVGVALIIATGANNRPPDTTPSTGIAPNHGLSTAEVWQIYLHVEAAR